VDWKILCAADFGDPTTRRRLFIQAVKGRKRIVWPEITHMDKDGQNLMGYLPWRSAKEIIDWSIPGTSIFDRKRPLAPATMRRIAAGIEKYWGAAATPFLAILRGTGTAESIDDPLSAITCSGAHHALIYPQPFITRYQGDHAGQQDGENRNHDLARPLPTVDTSNRYGIVEPFILPNEGFYRGNQARSIHDPLNTVTSRGAGGIVEPLLLEYYGNGGVSPLSDPIPTVTTKDRFALLAYFYGNHPGYPVTEPLKTVTTIDHHGLVEGIAGKARLDIRFRMLKAHELKQGQGFSKDYIVLGTAAEQVKQIGNAVPPGTAKGLSLAAMSA